MDFQFPHRLSFPNTKSSKRHNPPLRMLMRVVEEAFPDLGQVLETLKTSIHGLSNAEARVRLEKWGLNEVAHEKPPQWYIQLLLAFRNPFIFLLLGLAILSFFTGDREATVIISIMVLVSVGLRFTTEFRSQKAAEASTNVA